jgi:uncharacterized protein (UPF0332 family)
MNRACREATMPCSICAQAALLTKGLSFSSHKGTISGFGEQFVKAGTFPKQMGRELNRAVEKRQLGDYESSPAISNEDAEELLTGAIEFCGAVEQWIGSL